MLCLGEHRQPATDINTTICFYSGAYTITVVIVGRRTEIDTQSATSPLSSFLSFCFFCFFRLRVFCVGKNGCTRNVIYSTCPRTKTSLSRNFFPSFLLLFFLTCAMSVSECSVRACVRACVRAFLVRLFCCMLACFFICLFLCQFVNLTSKRWNDKCS